MTHQRSTITQTVRDLRAMLDAHRHHRAKQAGWIRRWVPTGLAPLDALLPHGGLPCGAVTEILSDQPGTGAMSLVIRIASRCGQSNDHGEGIENVGFNSEHPHEGSGDRDFVLPAVHSRMTEENPTVRHASLDRESATIWRSKAVESCSDHGLSTASIDRATRPSNCDFVLPAGQSGITEHNLEQASPSYSGFSEMETACTPPRPRGLPTSRDFIPPAARNMKTEDKRIDAAEDHRPIVVVDQDGDFYPPAALQYGLALERIIVVRPRNDRDAFWSVDQSLRCPGIAAVVARLGRLDERLSRKLQLAADRSGCMGLLLMSAKQRAKSFAAVRIIVEGVAKNNTEWPTQNGGSVLKHSPDFPDESYLCRITLLSVRDGVPAGPILVDLHHETGSVPVHSLSDHRSAARAG